MTKYINYLTTLKNKKVRDGKKLSPKTIRFLKDLTNKSSLFYLEKIISCPVSDFKHLKDEILSKHYFLKEKKTKATREVTAIFVNSLYKDKLSKSEFIQLARIKTCAYCNAVYLAEVGNSNSGQLDHFYPKLEYPYFAVSFYNLVPACNICNSSGSKGQKDAFIKDEIKNPYTGLDKFIRFDFRLTGSAIFDQHGGPLAIQIKRNAIVSEHVKALHLDDIYNFHSDTVNDLLIHIIHQIGFINSGTTMVIQELINKVFVVDEFISKRFYGFESDPENDKLTVLSKMKREVFYSLLNSLDSSLSGKLKA